MRLLTDPASYLRLVFVLLGSGLALSFGILDVTVIAMTVETGALPLWAVAVLGLVLMVAPIVGLGLVPAVRKVEAVAAESLLGIEFADGAPGTARTWRQRGRSLAWFTLHLLAGSVPVVLVVLAMGLGLSIAMPLLLLTTFAVSLVLGWALAVLAPRLLGPSYAERLEKLESDVTRAVERNRIAREIHDSVGHALSLVTVQAAAARKVIDHDLAFAVKALDAIESASRSATAELDALLGLLREDTSVRRRTTPELGSIGALVSATRAAGLDLDAVIGAESATLPSVVSREAYRIAQEALTNALRHSGRGTTTLRISLDDGVLELSVANPVLPTRANRSERRGRGLRGIEERAAALGGSMSTGCEAGVWRLAVSLPVPEKVRK